MAIPASMIVDVNPRLITGGGTDLEINGMFLTENDLLTFEDGAREFATPDAVAEFFGYGGEEHRAAERYFSGYANSFAKPRRVFFGRRVRSAISARLRGGTFAGTLEEIKEVTKGALKLTIDGVEVSVADLDLSSVTSFSEAARKIQEKIVETAESATVEYSSFTEAFAITSGTAGAESTITFAETVEPLDDATDLGDLLNLTEGAGAEISSGHDALSVAENMTAIRAVTDNWVCFTTVYKADSAEALEYAEWSGSRGVNYLYQPWTDTPEELTALNEVLSDANVGATAYIVLGLEFAAFVCGIGACIDWNRRDSVITYAFKHQDGLAVNAEDETEATDLMNAGANIYGNWATRNDNFVFLYPGKMYGDYAYIDPYINAVWLDNAIQVSIMNGLAQTPRVPYTDAGYALIRAWMADPVGRAVRNGAIEPGISLSEGQKAQLFREAGRDISSELNTDGYVIQIEDPGADARANRESSVCSLWYTYGGSVHRVSVASTAVL